MKSALVVLVLTACTIAVGAAGTPDRVVPELARDRTGVPDLAAASKAPDSLNPQMLDAYILETMETYHVPGLSACLIKADSIVWVGQYGWAHVGNQRPVAESTSFILASISKTLTAVALMQLWEEGKFQLDDPINEYLPWQVNHPVFPLTPITIRMLLTHTSGLRVDNATVLAPLVVYGGDSQLSLEEFLRGYLTVGGEYYDADGNFGTWVPGTKYEYGNISVTLAAFLVERLSGMSFEEYCADKLFGPLDMRRISWKLAGQNVSNLATPYSYLLGQYVAYEHYGFPMWPAGQARTSALDLAPHLLAFMNYGQYGQYRVLDSATVELMRTVQFPEIDDEVGLIWNNVQIEGRHVIGHTGSSPGAATGMYFDPDERLGAIVLTNGESPEGWAYVMDALFTFGADPDDDGVVAGYDNCPDRYNPDQRDTDQDGTGDACESCCTGPSVGNLDGSDDHLVTMGDLTVMIDYLFISLRPLNCIDEGNIDLSADGLVTMGDLTVLIDHLFISLAPLPPCP